LEDSVIDVLAGYGVRGTVENDPGVWIPPRCGSQKSNLGGGERCDDIQDTRLSKKIAAVGVHLRRYVSSYGVGLNITDEPIWFFRQIVACGLEGREATSLAEQGVRGVGIDQIAARFVRAFAERVNKANLGSGLGPGIDEVYSVEERDILHVD
jgi:lipoyl(octanoyl) transferase